MKMIQEKYTSLWREDVERLTKLHDKHMTQFASEVFAAIKHNSTTLDGLSSPPGAPTPVASPPRAPTTIISSPQIEQPMFGEDGAHISDPKTTPNTQFWVEASKIADEVELSAGKSANMRDPSSSTLSHTTEESITATARTSCRDYDIECPTFDLLPPGETWTQQFAPNNQQSSDYVRNGSTPRLQEPNITSGSAHLDNHHNHADQNPSAEPAIEKQSDPKSVATTPTTHDGNHSASLALQNSMQAPYTDVSQPSKIGTHTHPAIQKTPAANSTTSKAQTPDDGQYGNSDLHNSQHPPSPKDCQPAKLGIQTRGPIQKPSATKGVSTTAPTPIAKQYGSSALQISHQPPSPNVCQQLELVIQTRGSIQKASTTKCVSTTAPTPVAKHYGSSALQISQKPPSPNVCQQSQLDACTIGTQTQDKKNRKKRAFLGINNDANQKILNKLKVTDISKDIYETYITRRCIRPPLAGEDRPPFVDFGKYHISYEDFRDALKPRGRIDTHVMELYIRHFNFITNVATTIEPTCTKFAFFQSLTSKLCVPEAKFDQKGCLKEFMEAYKDHMLKSKDMLYFAVVDNEHRVLVSINLLYKQVNFLDSMISAKKTKVYEKAHNLVDNFITLATHAKAFPKTNFSQFVQNNPQDIRQQTTIFDCGVFVMLFMKMWDGKIMKPFSTHILEHRMVLTHMIMTSELNKANPTWVLKKK